MSKRYPPEFRRKVLDLVKAGRPVAQIAHDLQISDQTIYTWRKQDLIDTGELPGLSSSDQAELVAARRRIRELENELAIERRAKELLKEAVPPKGRYAVIARMAAEGLPVQVACRVLDVSESGYYDWRSRPPSARSLRHVWLTEQIRQVHAASHGTYGSKRVHAELRLGRGIIVGHCAASPPDTTRPPPPTRPPSPSPQSTNGYHPLKTRPRVQQPDSTQPGEHQLTASPPWADRCDVKSSCAPISR